MLLEKEVKTVTEKSVYSVHGIRMIRDYPEILTVKETSELLGVSTKTVYKLLKNGEIQKRSVGRSFRIPKVNVTEFLGIKHF